MRTVYDFIRGKSALEVTCRNCDNKRMLDMQHLKAKLGLHGRVAGAHYRCVRCGSVNVRLCAVDSQLSRLSPVQGAFGGIYDKYLD